MKSCISSGATACCVILTCSWLREVDNWMTNGGGCWGHPYALLKWTVLSRVAGSYVVFLSVGASLMDSLLTKLFLRVALSLACYRSYRDHESRQLALTIDPRADGPVIPD